MTACTYRIPEQGNAYPLSEYDKRCGQRGPKEGEHDEY